MKQIQLKKWNVFWTLPILLLTLSTSGCRTVVKETIPEIPIPTLPQIAERPVLETIQSIDIAGWSETEKAQLATVLATYDRNYVKLIVYVTELEGYSEAAEKYLDELKRILSAVKEEEP